LTEVVDFTREILLSSPLADNGMENHRSQDEKVESIISIVCRSSLFVFCELLLGPEILRTVNYSQKKGNSFSPTFERHC